MTRNIDTLGRLAADTAMRAAADYIRHHNLRYDETAMVECIRSWIKIKLPEALTDAKQAIDAGMGKMAETTFLASMKLAGIEAAKEAGSPKAQQPSGGALRGRARWLLRTPSERTKQ